MDASDEESRKIDDRPRILVVEPRRNYLTTIARRLSELDYRLMLADSVQTAVAALYRGPVDLVLSEFNGPGFNGRELIAMIRGDVVLRDVPILMFAGRSSPRDSVAALQAGADAIVKKPFHFEVLCARIERELQRKRAIDDLRTANLALDARVAERAITIGEMREQLAASEAERVRLQASIGARAC